MQGVKVTGTAETVPVHHDRTACRRNQPTPPPESLGRELQEPVPPAPAPVNSCGAHGRAPPPDEAQGRAPPPDEAAECFGARHSKLYPRLEGPRQG